MKHSEKLLYDHSPLVLLSLIYSCHFRGVREVRGGSVPHTAGCQSHGQTLPLQLFLLHELSPPPAGHAVLRQGWRPSVWGLLRGEHRQVVCFDCQNGNNLTLHSIWKIKGLFHKMYMRIIFIFYIRRMLSFFILHLYIFSNWLRKCLYLHFNRVFYCVCVSELPGGVFPMPGEDHRSCAQGSWPVFPCSLFPL